jgi:uncharacterized protein
VELRVACRGRCRLCTRAGGRGAAAQGRAGDQLGGYSGYFADPDGHPWEIVHVPSFAFSPAGQLLLPD